MGNIKRTITEVLNWESGECIDANDFFKKPIDELTVYRSELQKAIEGFRPPLFVCYYCKQNIRIRGGISRQNKRKADIFHFAHLKDSEECPVKTNNQFTKEEYDRMKYNGAKESLLHRSLKEEIVECLHLNQICKGEITAIEIEKVVNDKITKEWKKPDISAVYKSRKIAIELQLSTTWLDVITRRQHFYKEHGIYIFWIFHSFNLDDDLRKLTYNDVIYTNGQNAFIFDKESYELSKKKKNLVLKCFFKVYFRDEEKLRERWDFAFVMLSDLNFDENRFRVFYHDADLEKKLVEKEIEKYIFELKELDRLRLEKEISERKRKEVLEVKISDLNKRKFSLNKIISEVQQDENDVLRELSDLNNFLSKVQNLSERTVKHLVNEREFGRPFYGHTELLNALRDKYEKNIKDLFSAIEKIDQRQLYIEKKISTIVNLPKVVIANQEYSCINPSSDWKFIQQNYQLVKIIKKDLINELFANEYIQCISEEYEINRLQYSREIVFLYDFSNHVSELLKDKEYNYDFLLKQKEVLAVVSEEIKSIIELYFKNLVQGSMIELGNYTKRKEILSNEIREIDTEVLSIENQL